MKGNAGKIDKVIRSVLGIKIAIAGVYFKSWWGVIAIVPLVTSFTGFFALYKMLGINTCKTELV